MRTLCEGSLKVRMGRQGDKVLLEIVGLLPVAFLCDPEIFVDAQFGATVQVASLDAWCQFRAADAQMHLTVWSRGSGKRTCSFPIVDLCDAINSPGSSSLRFSNAGNAGIDGFG